MKTPNQEVAQRIISKIREQGLLSESTIAGLEGTLGRKQLTAEDWRLIVETDRPEDQNRGK